MVGVLSDFYYLVMLSLEAKGMWVVTCLRGWGMLSMVRFSSASSGKGGIVWLVMVEIIFKVSTQYLWMQGQVQKIWSMYPSADLHLQHVLGVWGVEGCQLSYCHFLCKFPEGRAFRGSVDGFECVLPLCVSVAVC